MNKKFKKKFKKKRRKTHYHNLLINAEQCAAPPNRSLIAATSAVSSGCACAACACAACVCAAPPAPATLDPPDAPPPDPEAVALSVRPDPDPPLALLARREEDDGERLISAPCAVAPLPTLLCCPCPCPCPAPGSSSLRRCEFECVPNARPGASKCAGKEVANTDGEGCDAVLSPRSRSRS